MAMSEDRRNKVVAWSAVGVVVAMVGLSFASVPLYDLFCKTTGFGGTTQRAESAPQNTVNRIMTVRFNADVAQGMTWQFKPAQRQVKVKLGEETLIHYTAHNPGTRPIVGVATFNVVPDQAGVYFDKIACFCFDEQRLEPGQTADLPVSFFVDPAILQDPNAKDVQEITLSYTFFEKPARQAALSSAPVAR